jgi:hypothetical protein
VHDVKSVLILIIVFVAVAPLAACGKARPRSAEAVAPANWKAMATPADLERISKWRVAFVRAIENARARGAGPGLAAEGALLDPDAALGPPSPPPGKYKCRTVKLGGEKTSPIIVYAPATCLLTAEGDVVGFARAAGSQRPVGLIFPGDGPRQIFLGTMMLGDEARALDYGQDATRDMAGAVERIGPNRWRLILPYPRMESMMDVIELVPDL